MTNKTTSKAVFLSLKPELHTLLRKKADAKYMNLQEYIYELIRKDVLAVPAAAVKKSNAGRPKKGDDSYMAIFSRKR